MIARTEAIAHTSRRAVYLTLLVVPWVAAAAWNAWELRAELGAWLQDHDFI